MDENISAPVKSLFHHVSPDLSAFVKSDPTPTILVSEDDIIVANAAAAHLLKVPLQGRSLSDVFVANDAPFQKFLRIVSCGSQPLPGSAPLHPEHPGDAPDYLPCTGRMIPNPIGAHRAVIVLQFLTTADYRSNFSALTSQVAALENEIKVRRAYQSEIRAALQSLEDIFENAAVGIAILDLSGKFDRVNGTFCDITGYDTDALTSMFVGEITHPDDVKKERESLAKLLTGDIQNYVIDKRYITKPGDLKWVRVTVSAMRNLDDEAQRYIAIVHDISKKKKLEVTRDLLMNEMNHRVKNTLAVVQGIVQQTLVTTPDPEKFSEALQPRLHSIGAAYDLLNQTDWSPLTLRQLIHDNCSGSFAPFASRVSHDGEDATFSPQTSIVMNLVLHELLTNAIKYGSLSNATGQVDIRSHTTLSSDQKRLLNIRWVETGGPAIGRLHKRGFGSFMLGRGIEFGLNGSSSYDFRPEGLVFELSIPLDTMADADTHADTPPSAKPAGAHEQHAAPIS